MPEYNSDDSDDDTSKPVEKPLFPSSSNVKAMTSVPIKSIELSKEVNTEQTVHESSDSPSPKSDPVLEKISKKKQSFASIITGGRSPQPEADDLQQYIEPVDIPNQSNGAPNETENLSQKTFQRKRRIEFNVSGVPIKRTHHNDESNDGTGGGESEPTKDTASTMNNAKARYTNFQKGESEFVEQMSTNSDDAAIVERTPADEMTDDQQMLESKLKFLCQGRADVSPVQIIQIQLQVSKLIQIDFWVVGNKLHVGETIKFFSCKICRNNPLSAVTFLSTYCNMTWCLFGLR